MFMITPPQMQAFSREMFVSWMVEHLAEFFSEETGALEENDVRSRINTSVEKARRYGLRDHADWCRFVDLTFVIGPDFDAEPWASAILADDRLTDPAMRMELLYEAAQDFCASAMRNDASNGEADGQWAC